MDIIDELEENQTVLLLASSIGYNDTVIETVKKLAAKTVTYVTINKTASSLKETFKSKGVNVDNIVFIDAITKTIKDVPDQADGIYYMSSPAALTEISMAVSNMLNHGFNYLIFDSVTNLLVYEQRAPVAKFIQVLVNKIKSSKTKAVFYALSVKEQNELIQETGMFVDKVV